MGTEIILGRFFCLFCIGVCCYVVFLVIKAEHTIQMKSAILPLMVYVFDYTQNVLKDEGFFRMKNNGDAPPENETEFINYFGECDIYCD